MIFACFCAQFLIWWCQHKLWRKVESTFPQSPLPFHPPPSTATFWRADSRKKPLKDSAKRSACKRLAAECQVASGKRVRVRVAFALASDSDYECECECECECKCECGLVVSLAAYKFVRGSLFIPSRHAVPHKGYNKGRASGLPTCLKCLHELRFLNHDRQDICYISREAITDNVRFWVHKIPCQASKVILCHFTEYLAVALSTPAWHLATRLFYYYYVFFLLLPLRTLFHNSCNLQLPPQAKAQRVAGKRRINIKHCGMKDFSLACTAWMLQVPQRAT